MNDQLALTVIGSQGVSEAITNIQEAMGGIGRRRAQTIVRTEVGRAFSTASQLRSEQAAEAVPGLKKQWRRSGKIHSRKKHDLTDGQVRPVDKPFILGTGAISDDSTSAGIRIMYPHDPAAPPAETINCGCISLPYMDSWAETGAIKLPGKKPFSEEEKAQNPTKEELANGPTLDEILGKATEPVKPAFICKAKTVAGAEKAAVSLGVKSADYAQSLDIGNEVNKALDMLGKRGLTVPGHVRIDRGIFTLWKQQLGIPTDEPAAFTMDKTTGETYLMVNPDDDYWAHPQMIADHQYQIGEWSTGHRYHAVVHESGHAAHYRAAPTLYTALVNQRLSAQESLIAAKISRYATKDPREFVAETFAVLATGGTVDADVLLLYTSLGGPKP